MSVDVVITVGHDSDRRGAVAVDGVTEWDFHRKTAHSLAAELAVMGIRAVVEYRTPGLGYTSAMAHLVARVNAHRPLVALELHFNAGGSAAHGAEALHWPGSVNGQRLATSLARACAIGGSVRNRGAVAQARSWNADGKLVDDNGDGKPDPQGPPLYFLRDTHCLAVIVETHFGSNAEDHRHATTARDDGQLAHAMAIALSTWVADHPR